MKAEILTIHFGINYGSVLQTYALSRVLETMELEVEIINYVPSKYKMWNEFKKDKIGKYSYIIIVAGFILKAPKKLIQRNIFEKFIKRNINLSRQYSSNYELTNQKPIGDLYIVGSDQVWNFDYNEKGDNTYFFDFLNNNEKKIAYAASLGKSFVSNQEEQTLKELLMNFYSISVREDETALLLNKLDLKTKHVLDPTLLICKEKWKELMNIKNKEEKYILIYVMDYLYEDLIEIAVQFSKKINTKIYMISFKRIADSRVDKQYIYSTPQKFLSLLYNAEYVVTNSFHGVAFSINFNRQFIAVGKNKYNLRIESLLRTLNIKKSIYMTNENRPIDYEQVIDYNIVNNTLEDKRRESLHFLQSAIAK